MSTGVGNAIGWCDRTWNPLRGCSLVSPGCTHCYAMRQAHRMAGPGQPYAGLTRMTAHGPVWTGAVRLAEDALDEPLRWRTPRRVFVNSMSDPFHEDVPDEWIDRVFAVMALARQHTFQVLTKRPERMRAYLKRHDVGLRWAWTSRPIANAALRDWPTSDDAVGWTRSGLPNVWLGVSVEDQATADARVPLLLQTPAAVRFVSYEPVLGAVDLTRLHGNLGDSVDVVVDALGRRMAAAWAGRATERLDHAIKTGLDWVIVGGESGPGARPCDVAWIRGVVRQCSGAGVPCYVKQLGGYAILDPRYDRSLAGWTRKLRDRKGADMAEWPEDLRVREFPPVERMRRSA